MASRVYRHHDADLKLRLAQLMLKGEQSPTELARAYGVRRSLLYQWKRQYQQLGAKAFLNLGAPHPQLVQEVITDAPLAVSPEHRIAELERLCGQQAAQIARLQWERDVLKKARDLLL